MSRFLIKQKRWAQKKVEEIGQSLYDFGGMERMLGVYLEFARRCPRHARNLEMVWNGIGEWMG